MEPPHYSQSEMGACLPACARMVLAALGDERTEAQLARLMETKYFGTPASRITRLERWGYQVEYGPSSLDVLQGHLGGCLTNVSPGAMTKEE